MCCRDVCVVALFVHKCLELTDAGNILDEVEYCAEIITCASLLDPRASAAFRRALGVFRNSVIRGKIPCTPLIVGMIQDSAQGGGEFVTGNDKPRIVAFSVYHMQERPKAAPAASVVAGWDKLWRLS
jgi:hypothetical protein